MSDHKLPAAIEAAIDEAIAATDKNGYHSVDEWRAGAASARASLVAAIAAHLPPAAPLTVGAALRSLSVLEWSDENDWHQYDPVERACRFRHRRAAGWSPWRRSAAPKDVAVRLVPLTDADASPETRGGAAVTAKRRPCAAWVDEDQISRLDLGAFGHAEVFVCVSGEWTWEVRRPRAIIDCDREWSGPCDVAKLRAEDAARAILVAALDVLGGAK